jgi:hypothetical protein
VGSRITLEPLSPRGTWRQDDEREAHCAS